MVATASPALPTEHLPLRRVLRAALRADLNAFLEFSFGIVRPAIPFRPNWHIDAVTHMLSRVASGEVRRLIITVPPRSLKSLAASVALPAWFLGRNPSERVVCVSYSDLLARAHANDFRAVVNHPAYQAAFPHMRLSRQTDRDIATTLRGRRYATSIDGTLTGLGGNLLVIDDPIKPGDAQSEAVRQRVNEWYRSTLLSRPDDKPTARIVLVMQRVHEDDLAGYLEKQGGFERLDLPAIGIGETTHELGYGRTYTRHDGEVLHPEREPPEILAEIRRAMGPIAFSAQYQQRPIPFGGNIIKRQWLRFYDQPQGVLEDDRLIASWDIALSELETGDYSAGVILLQRGETSYVLDIVRGRFSFTVLKAKILEVQQRYGSPTLLIEDSPISRGLIQSLKESHVSVVAVRPDTDKRSRLVAQSDRFAAGSVFIDRRAPCEDLVAELLAFPGGAHDDQVDALTQALAWVRSTPVLRGGWAAIGGMH